MKQIGKKLAALEVDAYIATGRLKHGKTALAPRGRIPKDASTKERMSRKLRTVKGKSTYSPRKHIVEPVFGQIKEARNFRRFSFRGLAACRTRVGLGVSNPQPFEAFSGRSHRK